MLIGYDYDGVVSTGLYMPTASDVVISGRTFEEYEELKTIAQVCPVYIRGSGRRSDRKAAGLFKANMIKLLGVTVFYEDDPVQWDILKLRTGARIVLVKGT